MGFGMYDAMFPVLLALFLAFFVGVVVLMVVGVVKGLGERRRRRAWLEGRGWRYIGRWPEMVGQFRHGPFGKGSSRQADEGFQGVYDGLPVSGFGYSYQTGMGQDATTHSYEILRVQLMGATFPELLLAHENPITRALVRDTTFEDVEFNRSWFVHGPNGKFTHDVVHPRMMEYLKTVSLPLDAIWFEGDSIMLAVSRMLRAEQVDDYLRVLTKIASLVPPFVLRSLGSGPPAITWYGATPDPT